MVASLRQDWSRSIGSRAALRAGVELTRSRTDFDYHRKRGGAGLPVVLDLQVSPVRTVLGIYAAQRVRLSSSTVVEVGARRDGEMTRGESAWNPRIHIVRDVDRRTTLRIGWGRITQLEHPSELQVADGQFTMARGDRATHQSAELERRSLGGVVLHAEGYTRIYSRVRPRFIDLGFGPVLLPEADSAGRLYISPSGRKVVGAVLSLEAPPNARLSWSASYALTHARDRTAGTLVPTPFDQRHGVHARLSYGPMKGWTMGAAWQLRSGWPYTQPTYEVTLGTDEDISLRRSLGGLNAERLGVYHRLDFRVRRDWRLRQNGVALTMDVLNVFNRHNPGPSFKVAFPEMDAPLVLTPPTQMLRRLTNFGIQWTF
jgi:hypothetical protein